MIIRFFSHGDGSGGAAVDYLLAEEVAAYDQKRRRISGQTVKRSILPEVISGDAELTRMLIDNNHRKWRYTSGVIAFAASDNPSPDEQAQVMSGFEDSAFAGMADDQCNILWVRHQHMGNVELHFLIPRVELIDGRAFNPAPPNAGKFFNAFRDYWNAKEGWADPNAPENRRDIKLVFETGDRKAIREAVHMMVLQEVENGSISNHSDVRNFLSGLGEVGIEIKPLSEKQIARRAKQDAIEITTNGEKMRCRDTRITLRKVGSTGSQGTFRMEDRIYHEEWTADEYFAAKAAREGRNAGERKPRADRASVERLRTAMQNAIARRADSNRTRYRRSARTGQGFEHPNQGAGGEGFDRIDYEGGGADRDGKIDALERNNVDGDSNDPRRDSGFSGQLSCGLAGASSKAVERDLHDPNGPDTQPRDERRWRPWDDHIAAARAGGDPLPRDRSTRSDMPQTTIRRAADAKPDPAGERIAALRRRHADEHANWRRQIKLLQLRAEEITEQFQSLRGRIDEIYRSAAERARNRAETIAGAIVRIVEVMVQKPDGKANNTVDKCPVSSPAFSSGPR